MALNSPTMNTDENSPEFKKVYAKWGNTHTIEAVHGTKPDLRKLKDGQSVCWGDGKTYHFLLTKITAPHPLVGKDFVEKVK